MSQHKRQYIAAFLFGICATLTLPPFYIFPLLLPAYGGFFYLLQRSVTIRNAMTIGFFWGWGFYITSLYWFTIALLTDPEKFAWLIPFALFGLTAVIALYPAMFSAAYFKCRRHGVRGAFIFAVLWLIMEWLRGHLFTGFPWNLAGYVFAISESSLQLASVNGAYGLTFLAVWVGAMSAVSRRAAWLGWIMIIISVGWGYQRVSNAPHDMVAGVKLRLVQANIAQHHKWDPVQQMAGLREHADLTLQPGIETITHVIWPETAVPYVLEDNSVLAARLGQLLRPGQYLITGALRGHHGAYSNSVVMLDHAGSIVGQYDKYKLVPFGEFLPLRWLIPDALETPVGMQDLKAGQGSQVLQWPGLPGVAPLICYEVIFPGLSGGQDTRPDWLLSLTNDAWFGTSTAPYQHLAMARMRAVEQGVPMVRVANTGISAVYDAYGREISRIALNEQRMIDTELPKKSQKETVYSRWFF